MIVRKEDDNGDGLVASGIDIDADHDRVFVFDASFAPSLLCNFVAAVLGDPSQSSIIGYRAIGPRAPSEGDGGMPGSEPGPDASETEIPPGIVVVPDPGPGGGPKIHLVALARTLLAASDEIEGIADEDLELASGERAAREPDVQPVTARGRAEP